MEPAKFSRIVWMNLLFAAVALALLGEGRLLQKMSLPIEKV
jgi:hypothetical protein